LTVGPLEIAAKLPFAHAVHAAQLLFLAQLHTVLRHLALPARTVLAGG